MRRCIHTILLICLFFCYFQNMLGATEGRTVNIAKLKKENNEYLSSNSVSTTWYWQPKLIIDSIDNKKVHPDTKININQIFKVTNDDEGDYKLSIINENTEDFIAEDIQIFYRGKLIERDDVINLKAGKEHLFEINVEIPKNVLPKETAKFYITATEQDTNEVTSKEISLIVEGKLEVKKISNKKTTIIGEKIEYKISVKNSTTTIFNHLKIFDSQLNGINVIKDSVKISGVNNIDIDSELIGDKIIYKFSFDKTLLPNEEIELIFTSLINNDAKEQLTVNETWVEGYDAENVKTDSNKHFLELTVLKESVNKIEIEKKVSKENIYIGDEIKYVIEITNTTNEILNKFLISDEVLEGIDIVANSIKISNGTLNYTLEKNKFNFSILGVVFPNEKIIIKYKGLITHKIVLKPTFTEGMGYGQTHYYNTKKNSHLLNLTQTLKENLLVISKEADKNIASIGELIKYNVVIKNTTNENLNELIIFDKIPRGLKLKEKSVTTKGMSLTTIKKGIETSFKLNGIILPKEEIKLTYVLLVTNSVKIGDVTNFIKVKGMSNKYYYNSNVASAVVKIQDDLFEEKSIIFGRIFVDKNNNSIFDFYEENEEIGVPGVKVYLENGDYAITDKEGMYSIYGQRSITHVVKIDEHTIPKGAKLKKLTNKHNKKGNLSYADLKTGQLHKVNFAFIEFNQEFLEKIISRKNSKIGFYNELQYELSREYNFKKINNNNSNKQSEIVKDNHKEINFSLKEDKLKIEDNKEINSSSLEERLQEMSNELGFINIKEGSRLGKISTIRIKGPRGGYLNLYVNGKLVPLDKLGSRASSQQNNLFFLEYNLIDLKYGKNKLTVSYSDAFQIEREKKDITVFVPGKQSSFKIETLSPLIADSSKPIKIKIIGIDNNKLQIIDPITIEAEITEGKWYDKNSDPDSKKLNINSKTGEYIFMYLPPNEPKTIKMRFTSNVETKEIELKLSPNLRPLTVSGILEGRYDMYNKTNNKTIDGYIIEDSLDGYNSEEQTSYSNRNAIFAKGVVAKDYLLTLFYDDNKKETNFFKDMDLNEHYLIYGDSSIRGYEGKSTSHLYLKIDKNYSTLLYGDYSADWTKNETTKLGKINRTLTGGYHKLDHEKLLINTFIAETEYNYTTEEQRGRGISGPYHLKNNNIVVGSEKITLIVRDRVLNSVVIKEIKLSRNIDYTLDYNTASIYFMEPVASTTPKLNPVFVRIDYEVEEGVEKYLVWGNNLEYKFNEKLLLGWNFAKDNNPDNELEVKSIFGKIDFNKNNIATMEYAQTQTKKSGIGSGWRADFKRKTKQNNLTLEYYTTDKKFDNNSSSLSRARESYILESSYNLDGSDTAFFNGKYELEKETKVKKQEIEAGIIKKINALCNLELKGRYAFEENEETNESMSIGARLKIKSKQFDKLSYFFEFEQDLSDFDKKRLAVGSDYQLEAKTKLYVRQELFSTYEESFVLTPTNSSSTTLIGVESDYFNTATLFSEYSVQNSSSEREMKASMGVKKNVVLSEKISGDFTFEKIFPIKYKGNNKKDESTAATISYKVEIDEFKKFSGNIEGSLGTNKDVFTNKFGYIEKISNVGSFIFKERYIWEDNKNNDINKKGRVSLGYAHRDYYKDINNWLLKSEINYTEEKKDNYYSLSYILSHARNYQFSKKNIGTLTLSTKYTEEKKDKILSNYFAYLLATNYSIDITEKLDLNLNAAIYGDKTFNNNRYGLGAEIGMKVQDNLWISGGYNITGFTDKDFDQYGYYRQGLYIRFRINFDEDLFSIRKKK